MRDLGKAFLVVSLMHILIAGFRLVLKFDDICEGVKECLSCDCIYVVCHDLVPIIREGVTIMFEEILEKITNIEKTMVLLLDLHMQQTNSLTTYNEVALFLGKSRRTVQTYVKESKLVANKHYYIDENGKTVFIPKAIMEFKNSPVEPKAIKSTITVAPRVMHPIATKLLQGVA